MNINRLIFLISITFTGFTFCSEQKEQSELNNQLINAARDGNKEQVQKLLKQCADVNAQNNYGHTALYWAACKGHTQIVEILLKSGADVNAREDNFGSTALTCAARNGHSQIVELLLKSGADVNTKDKYGDTALMEAACECHTQTVELLLNSGADVNAQSNGGWTALMKAARRGHTQIVELLLNAGADVNVKSNYGNTALMRAVHKDYTQIVNLISTYQNEYLAYLNKLDHEYDYQTLSDIASQTSSPMDLAQLINEYAKCKLTFSEFLVKKQLPYYENFQDMAVSACSIQ